MYLNPLDKLMESYCHWYRNHQIHHVENGVIELKWFPIEEFAVNVKIIGNRKAEKSFKSEMKRHIECLNTVGGSNIGITALISYGKRVTYLCGVAGVGKSVIAKQIALGWATGKIYQGFKLCIMFECRDLNYFRLNEGADVRKHDLLAHFLKEKFNLDIADGDGVLFVIDGLDELFDINNDDSIIYQLLNIKNQYMKSHVIITGRPHVQGILEKSDIDMGGCTVLEILGLNDKQIEEYIAKFAMCQDVGIAAKNHQFIESTKSLSARIRSIMSVPQFLNTVCCVAILTEGKEIHNATELYCWVLYLLLKQHFAEKANKQGKHFIGSIFNTYSHSLMFLSEISYKLLLQNEIIFKKSSFQHLYDQMEVVSQTQKTFIESLFMQVPDNYVEKYQFKHLSIMEFLAAVYCLSTDNAMTLVPSLLRDQFFETVSYMCGLFGSVLEREDGISKELVACINKDKRINQNFLINVLHEVNKSEMESNIKLFTELHFISEYLPADSKNKDLIDEIMLTVQSLGDVCVYNLTATNQMYFIQFIEVMKNNGITDDQIVSLFKNIEIEDCNVSNVDFLNFRRFFENLTNIIVEDKSICAREMEIINTNLVYCTCLTFECCKFIGNDHFENRNNQIENSRFEGLYIKECEFTENHVSTIISWLTSCPEVTLRLVDLDQGFWELLLRVIEEKAEYPEHLTIELIDFFDGICEAAVKVFVLIETVSLREVRTYNLWDILVKAIEESREQENLKLVDLTISYSIFFSKVPRRTIMNEDLKRRVR